MTVVWVTDHPLVCNPVIPATAPSDVREEFATSVSSATATSSSGRRWTSYDAFVAPVTPWNQVRRLSHQCRQARIKVENVEEILNAALVNSGHLYTFHV